MMGAASKIPDLAHSSLAAPARKCAVKADRQTGGAMTTAAAHALWYAFHVIGGSRRRHNTPSS